MFKNVSKNRSKIIRFCLISILVFFLLKFSLSQFVSSHGYDNRVFSPSGVSKLDYLQEPVKTTEGSFDKPVFKDDFLNEYVDDFIEKNTCTTLYYDIFEMGNNIVNIFLDCGKKSSLIYDYQNEKTRAFKDNVKDYESFVRAAKRLLNLKYPEFVTEEVDFEKAIYDIKENQLIGYYETKNYGQLEIRINNNEIKDFMTYEMHYDDAYENEIYTLSPDKKTIAFTFDDGPSPYEPELIDFLVKSHSEATFYLVGSRLELFPKSIEAMTKNKMEVGNHTFDHRVLTTLSDEEIKEEITKTNDLYYELTKEKMTSLRPSYGSINKRVLVQIGMPVILWSLDTLDWKSRDADKIAKTILNEVEDGDIVLMHSLYGSTVEAVKKVLPELYKEGYQVTSVSKLAKLKNFNLTGNKTVSEIK